jgi:hypothetical protein
MSSHPRKRSASPSGDPNSSNKRQRKNGENKEDEKQHENQLDEKEREVKEDITAAALPIHDPDLVVSPSVDKDLICSICFSLLTKPISKF